MTNNQRDHLLRMLTINVERNQYLLTLIAEELKAIPSAKFQREDYQNKNQTSEISLISRLNGLEESGYIK